MKDLEEMLKENKIQDLKVPDELEGRLRKALDNKKPKRKNSFGLIAASLIFLLVFTFNFDAIAYYTRQFLGFDNIMTGTLKDLNNMGKGQIVDKGFTMDNGVSVILDGVMVDRNQLIAFFTITRDGQKVDFHDFNLGFINLNGLTKRYFARGGIGQINDDMTEIKYIYEFDPPSPFERYLTFTYYYNSNGTTNEEKISFRLDRKKSMGFLLTEKINKTVELDNSGKVHFDTISVSPTKTVIEGTLDVFYNIPTPLDLPSPALRNIPQLEIELIADGIVIPKQGGSMGSKNDREIKFSLGFDTVPPETKKLEIIVAGMTERIKINREIELELGENYMHKDILDLVGDNRLTIKDFIIKEGINTISILTGGKHPIIEKAYLVSQEERLALQYIDGGDLYIRVQDQIEVLWTLNFKGTLGPGPYILEIQTISFLKPYNKSISLQISQ